MQVRDFIAFFLIACSVVACDDGGRPGPGTGGEAGQGGKGGEGGAAGGGGTGGQALEESCDHLTRCATPGSVCREDGQGWKCVIDDVPEGMECADHDECGPGWPVAQCSRSTGDATRVCKIVCFYDVTCPEGMVCDGRGLCAEPEE